MEGLASNRVLAGIAAVVHRLIWTAATERGVSVVSKAEALSLDGSYTPEIVVDGSTGLVGSDRGDVGQAIAKAKAGSSTFADVRVVTKDGNASIDVGAGQGAAHVVLVGFDREHVTSIRRGENRGSTMSEANIVRSFPAGCGSGAERRSTSTSDFRKANRSRSSLRRRTAASSAHPKRFPPARPEEQRPAGRLRLWVFLRFAAWPITRGSRRLVIGSIDRFEIAQAGGNRPAVLATQEITPHKQSAIDRCVVLPRVSRIARPIWTVVGTHLDGYKPTDSGRKVNQDR
jgi:hypothetical protein